jgi:hypothetical protein
VLVELQVGQFEDEFLKPLRLRADSGIVLGTAAREHIVFERGGHVCTLSGAKSVVGTRQTPAHCPTCEKVRKPIVPAVKPRRSERAGRTVVGATGVVYLEDCPWLRASILYCPRANWYIAGQFRRRARLEAAIG